MTGKEEETVTISKKKYDSLVSDAYALRCLEDGGVDNWDWYSESMAPWYKKYDPDYEEDEDDEF